MSAQKTMDSISRAFVTLGMFIIDDFTFADRNGIPTGQSSTSQERLSEIGGGGTYAAIGARIWLPAEDVGMIVDRGHDFPVVMEDKLLGYGPEMWLFRDQPNHVTTRALNSYRGEQRSFEYLTKRIRITPKDLVGTKMCNPRMLHFICSPQRASTIMSEVEAIKDWCPTVIYEPIPDRCIPAEMPALIEILPSIDILSPNAEEALSLLSIDQPPSRSLIEQSADRFLEYGIGNTRGGWIIIRSGELGAYVKSRLTKGRWIDAFWTAGEAQRVVDVTGAGNSFLGGLSAGLLSTGDVIQATFYASVSASFIVEQSGLPVLSHEKNGIATWNSDVPQRRLEILLERHEGRDRD